MLVRTMGVTSPAASVRSHSYTVSVVGAEGLDGVQKMSKSLGNYVGIAEEPGEQFGKVMSIPDALMPRWFQLTTGWLPDRVDAVTEDLRSGALAPVAAKRLLARTVVDLYHGDGAGEAAEAEFDRVFRDHAVPTDVEERSVFGEEPAAPRSRRLAILIGAILAVAATAWWFLAR